MVIGIVSRRPAIVIVTGKLCGVPGLGAAQPVSTRLASPSVASVKSAPCRHASTNEPRRPVAAELKVVPLKLQFKQHAPSKVAPDMSALRTFERSRPARYALAKLTPGMVAPETEAPAP